MIEKGADINTEGKAFTDASNGASIKTFTPLTCAALKNHLEAVKFLLEKGAKTGGIEGLFTSGQCPGDLKNKSAIYFAIENNNMEMVKYIAEHNGFDGKKMSVFPTKNIKTLCTGGTSYSPSAYALQLGFGDIQDYLKKTRNVILRLTKFVVQLDLHSFNRNEKRQLTRA